MHVITKILLVFVCLQYSNAQAPASLTIAGLFPLSGLLAGGGVERESAARIAVEAINNNTEILPNTELIMLSYDTGTSKAIGLTAFLNAAEEGAVAIVGAASSSVSEIVAIAGGVYNIPQLSYSSTSASLSNKDEVPLFGRLVPPDNNQGAAFAYFVALFGWEDTISAISTADEYGVGGVDQFIENGASLGVRTRSYQQFLSGTTEIDVEMNELALSKARVFLAFLLGKDAQTVLTFATRYQLIGDTYVWLCSDGCAQISTFTDENREVIPRIREAARGIIGMAPSGGKGELFELFLDDWEHRSEEEFPGAGDRTINLFGPHAYDCVWTFALAFDQLIKEGKPLDSDAVISTIRALDFIGLTGRITFESNGDRIAVYDVSNLQDNDQEFTDIGSWSAQELLDNPESNGFTLDKEIQFFDGTTNIPDLDVRSPFDYWDCHKKEKGSDPTGKEIDLETPDRDNPRFIAESYHCDQFIDCDNMSDEGFDCVPSYTAVFISFGILTGMLMITIPFFVAVAISFGFIWKKRRIRLLSPIFLLGMCFAVFLGYSSTFAWYGKPHVVACNFQPWLLGISVNLMIAFLFVKTFRIWRIFNSPFRRQKITDLQLLIIVGIIMIPSMIILICWTSFSTPTATVVEIDDMDHFVCETGGLTGPPGGIIFFSIFVGYTGIILLFGVFLAFVTRNVPDEYSESKLVGYSVYNLTFLAAVVIPVFFVLRDSNPVAAWIIRTVAILYAFTATLWLQFLPPLVLLVFRDRCAAVPPQKGDYIGSSASASVG